MKNILSHMKNHLINILYLIIMTCYGIAVFIFRPSFYYENNIFDIVFGLLLMPILIGIISTFLYVILKYILEKASHMDDTNIGVIVVIISLVGVIYLDCHPKAYDYQYIVNIYDDYGSVYCRKGYVDIESADDCMTISRIYYDTDTYFDDVEADAIDKNDLTNGSYISITYDNKPYYIEFMKKK